MQCRYKTGQGISSLNDIVGFLSTKYYQLATHDNVESTPSITTIAN